MKRSNSHAIWVINVVTCVGGGNERNRLQLERIASNL